MNPRKALSRHVYAFVLLTLIASGALLRAAPEPVDPVVGSWVWHGSEMTTFRADGTVRHSHGAEGTWQYLHNPEVQRHYRVVWKHGVNIDEVVCSEDGQRAHVRNDRGVQFEAHRALDDKPAASPVGVAPDQITAAKPADPAEPLIGDWRWGGDKATFAADGTITTAKGGTGTWKYLNNPEADRQYKVEWSGGKFSVDLTYDRAARVGHAVNNRGKKFDVVPWSAASPKNASGKPADYFGSPGR